MISLKSISALLLSLVHLCVCNRCLVQTSLVQLLHWIRTQCNTCKWGLTPSVGALPTWRNVPQRDTYVVATVRLTHAVPVNSDQFLSSWNVTLLKLWRRKLEAPYSKYLMEYYLYDEITNDNDENAYIKFKGKAWKGNYMKCSGIRMGIT